MITETELAVRAGTLVEDSTADWRRVGYVLTQIAGELRTLEQNASVEVLPGDRRHAQEIVLHRLARADDTERTLNGLCQVLADDELRQSYVTDLIEQIADCVNELHALLYPQTSSTLWNHDEQVLPDDAFRGDGR